MSVTVPVCVLENMWDELLDGLESSLRHELSSLRPVKSRKDEIMAILYDIRAVREERKALADVLSASCCG